MRGLIVGLWLLAAPATDLWLLGATCFIADEPEFMGRYIQAETEIGGYGPVGDGYVLAGFIFREATEEEGPDSTWTQIVREELQDYNFHFGPSVSWPEERVWGEDYRLRLVVDPDDRIEETDETNNVVETVCVYVDGTQ